MAKKKNVTVIPAASPLGEGRSGSDRKRVAAYCRVSTDREEQETSFESQVQHFHEIIRLHPGWDLAEVYVDDGISALNTAKREGFNRMISDCRKGKIDLVLTKSLSRFARNTVDALTTIRELKSLRIPIIFEKENINTMDANGEFLLTIMASLAQQESLSLSQNVQLGLRYKYQRGEFSLSYSNFLGYTMNDENELVIVPEEAVIIQRIYREFLEGKTERQIGQGLMADGIKSPAGTKNWYAATIERILQNEKYEGDVLIQKTCTTDVLNNVRSVNNGLAPQYYIRDDHEPIISREMFLEVQAELALRHRAAEGHPGKPVRRRMYPFSQKVVCGTCGDIYTREMRKGRNGKRYISWACRVFLEFGAAACSSPRVKEGELEEVVLRAVQRLFDNSAEAFAQLEQRLIEIGRPMTFEELDENLTELKTKKAALLSSRAEARTIMENEIAQDELLIEHATKRKEVELINRILDFLQRGDKPDIYDPCFMENLVKCITVYDESFTVEFYGGLITEVEKDLSRWKRTRRRKEIAS